jgi:glucosylceramidase
MVAMVAQLTVQERSMQALSDICGTPRSSMKAMAERNVMPETGHGEKAAKDEHLLPGGSGDPVDWTLLERHGIRTGKAPVRHSETAVAPVGFPDLGLAGTTLAVHGAAGAIPGSPASRCAAGIAVKVWQSTVDQKDKLTSKGDVALQEGPVHARHVIDIDCARKYQQMEGFGASFTDSSASLLDKSLTPQARSEVMKQLFSRDGIHISLIRQPMGACDYNLNLFTYDDEPGDINLEKFSIAADKKHMIPCIKEALRENPDVRILATPWSAPGWMKTSGSIIGGALKPECYKVYANYFTRFIEAYRDEGITIHGVTIQNEPLFVPGHYPGMSFPAREEATFIKTALGPAFKEKGIESSILIYDHNWDRPDYPETILDDSEANKYIAGVAWHYYGGSHEAMTKVHDAHPDKGVWFTEGSGGEWVPEYHDAFMDQMKHVIRIPRNWSKSLVWWNLALDQDHGPSLLGEGSTCRGLVKVDTRTGEVSNNVDYYTMGHISKFVDRGAYRIGSTWYENDLEDVAFQNPDGSKVLIVSNRTREAKTFAVKDGEKHFEYTIPGEGAVTFTW